MQKFWEMTKATKEIKFNWLVSNKRHIQIIFKKSQPLD